MAGQGVFGRDKLPGLFSIKDMVLSPLRRTEARGDLRLDVAGGKVLLDLAGGLVPGENPFEGAFVFPLSGEPFTGSLKGSLTDLDLIVPWDGAKGRLNYVADLKEEEPETRVSVAIDASIPLLPLPGFAYAVTDFRLTGRYLDNVLTMTSIGGILGGGALTGSGEAGFGAGGIATLDLKLEGRDVVLAPMERVRTQADASLRLIKDRRRFVTEGEILFKRLDWRREIYEEFGFSSQSEPGTAGPSTCGSWRTYGGPTS